MFCDPAYVCSQCPPALGVRALSTGTPPALLRELHIINCQDKTEQDNHRQDKKGQDKTKTTKTRQDNSRRHTNRQRESRHLAPRCIIGRVYTHTPKQSCLNVRCRARGRPGRKSAQTQIERPGKNGQDRTGQDRTSQDRTGQDRTRQRQGKTRPDRKNDQKQA